MGPGNHGVHIDLESSQATLLLERLEALRGELGMVAEDLISLLQGAGIAPFAEPDPSSDTKNNPGIFQDPVAEN